jgi:hypothetical protein
MEADRSQRIAGLKAQIHSLKKEELRLRWMITSEFSGKELRMRADEDLKSVLNNLRAAEIELGQLENDK